MTWTLLPRAATCALVCALASLSCASYVGTARTVDAHDVGQEPGWVQVPGVPVVRQEHTSDCGSAALSSVLRYWGKNETARGIERQLGRDEEEAPGARAGDLRDYARERALSAYVFEGTLEDIHHELTIGRPVIVGVHQPLSSGRVLAHYLVVVGYHPKRDRILVMDPAHGWREDSVEGFAREWGSARRLTLVVFPPADVRSAGAQSEPHGPVTRLRP